MAGGFIPHPDGTFLKWSKTLVTYAGAKGSAFNIPVGALTPIQTQLPHMKRLLRRRRTQTRAKWYKLSRRLKMFCFSVFLTIISIVAHLSTYIGIYFLNEYYSVFGFSYVIHVLIFIPLFAMVFQIRFGKNKVEKIKSPESFNPALAFKRYFPNTDYRIGIIFLVIFIYAFFNFYFSVNKLVNGMPEISSGKYILNNHGKIMEIDKKEYVKMCYTQLKAFSGHWIIFSIIPLIYSLDRRKANDQNK